jgi:hypothetical protein
MGAGKYNKNIRVLGERVVVIRFSHEVSAQYQLIFFLPDEQWYLRSYRLARQIASAQHRKRMRVHKFEHLLIVALCEVRKAVHMLRIAVPNLVYS